VPPRASKITTCFFILKSLLKPIIYLINKLSNRGCTTVAENGINKGLA